MRVFIIFKLVLSSNVGTKVLSEGDIDMKMIHFTLWIKRSTMGNVRLTLLIPRINHKFRFDLSSLWFMIFKQHITLCFTNLFLNTRHLVCQFSICVQHKMASTWISFNIKCYNIKMFRRVSTNSKNGHKYPKFM